MEISLHHAGGARFVAEAREHRIVLDQPAEDGATNQGMSPAELLLASLGGCVGQYAVQYLSLRGLSSKGLTVRVAAQPSARPLELRDFIVEIIAPELSDRHLRLLEKSCSAGLVQNAIRFENSVQVAASCAAATEKPSKKSS